MINGINRQVNDSCNLTNWYLKTHVTEEHVKCDQSKKVFKFDQQSSPCEIHILTADEITKSLTIFGVLKSKSFIESIPRKRLIVYLDSTKNMRPLSIRSKADKRMANQSEILSSILACFFGDLDVSTTQVFRARMTKRTMFS